MMMDNAKTLTPQDRAHYAAQLLRKDCFITGIYTVELGLLIESGCAALGALDVAQIRDFIKRYNELAETNQAVREHMRDAVFQVAQLVQELELSDDD